MIAVMIVVSMATIKGVKDGKKRKIRRSRTLTKIQSIKMNHIVLLTKHISKNKRLVESKRSKME